jgi:mxaL protein
VSGLIAGIGGTVPEPIPWLDEEGQVAGYWTRDEVMQVDRHSLGRPTQGGEAMAGADRSDIETRIAAGNEHLSSLRESYLRQLAAETGLDYLPATNGEEFVRMLLDEKYAYRQPILTNVASVPAALGLLCLVYLFGSPVVSRLRARRGLPRARLSLET